MKLARFFVTFVLIVALGGRSARGLPSRSSSRPEASSRTRCEVDALLPAMDSPAERSYVFDRNGNLMTTLFAEEDRAPVKLADVPQQLIDAVLAIEDREFYEHNGVDWAARRARSSRTSTRARSSRAARRSPSSSSRTR